MGLLEVGHRAAETGPVQVLRQLEVGGGEPELRWARPGPFDDLVLEST